MKLLKRSTSNNLELFSEKEINERGYGFRYKKNEYITFSEFPLNESAFLSFSRKHKYAIFTFLLLFIFSLIFNAHLTILALVFLLTVIYFSDLLFNLLLVYRASNGHYELNITKDEINRHDDKWPIYTIYCPLYKEAHILPQFVNAIKRLDYPKDRMQVMLLLEEDDTTSVEAANKMNLPSYFEVHAIPHAYPKTKPKALNFGLTKSKGEFAVIYDAEDIPEKDQLKKAVIAFEKSDEKVICIQAKLDFYNPHQNILTKVFTAEYSLWFSLVLTGLMSIDAPIPLGGTSNHFRLDKLRILNGWDPFNVTEDCDLGIRLYKRGYRTQIINSHTFEEANSGYLNWIKQRSRWIKGYMQTYFVHMRNPAAFRKDWKDPHILTFQLIVGGKVSSILINPIMWLLTICYFAFRPFIGPTVESFFPGPVLYMAIASLVVGNFLYTYYYMIGCARKDYDELLKYVFLVPLYWLSMSIAAWLAIFQLFLKPHYWFKTSHGFHLKDDKVLYQISSLQ